MEIKCEFFDRNWSNGVKYSCELSEMSKISIIQPESRIATFEGIHLAGKTNMLVLLYGTKRNNCDISQRVDGKI